MQLRVLTWNLKHGRSEPPSRRELLEEFGGALAGWEWDVALLQEVPPWWTAPLALRLGAEHRQALTSRNALPSLRRALARRWPEVMKSQGGGANAILARRDRIVAHQVMVLTRAPERRVAHGVVLGCGLWVVNLHATAHDAAAAERDGTTAAAAALRWAGRDPVVLGGDFNLRAPEWSGFAAVGGHDVDHVFVAGGVQARGRAEVLERGALSDHAPVAVDLRLMTSEDGDRPDV
ncbi:MAG TPA: endonuclease/exonuclease/phosphatase family protein [Solirubrobacteraceae bacterium]|nr:endonuclease/exonuclease/phosphatase family protein [Solirubrobacteraceae bacterium]